MRALASVRSVGVFVLLLIVAAVGVVGVTNAEEPEGQPLAAASADCSYEVQQARTAQEIWRELSQHAERIAPTRPGVDGEAVTKRRRSSGAPKMPDFTARNFIDEEIFGKMKRDGVMWTSPSPDAEFLRRASLDLAATLPDADQVKAFLADTSADKRDRVIETLLRSEGYTDRWTMFFGDLLMNVMAASNSSIGPTGRNAYHTFIRQSVAANKPYDQFVREVIAGAGATARGESSFYRRQIQSNGPIQDTYDNLAAFSGEKFLGLPLNCLSCHGGIAHLELVNSGLARRSRMDFWKTAAFFAQTNTRRENGDLVVYDDTALAYKLNTTSGNKTPRQPAQGAPDSVEPAFFLTGETPRPGEPRRQAFGRMLTAHPQFARAAVNYIWQEMFGVGLVEPADSFDLLRQDPATLAQGQTLQPSHPELLNKLSQHFIDSGYDVRALLRTIVQSNAYQLSSRYTAGSWSELYAPYYARHYPRRLMSEALLDAIIKSTAVPATLLVSGGVPTIGKAMQLPDPTEGGFNYLPFLNGFGRGDRDETRRSSESSIAQALILMNDRMVLERVRATQPNSTMQRLLQRTRDPKEVTEHLYLVTLSRYPTEEELKVATDYLADGDFTSRAEDVLFSLLNRVEFMFN